MTKSQILGHGNQDLELGKITNSLDKERTKCNPTLWALTRGGQHFGSGRTVNPINKYK